MSLLDSLLDAIVRLGGDSLVMHVGERPYVVTSSRSLDAVRGPLSWGQVELSSRPLTPDAVLSMLAQVLPPEARHEFDDVGAVEHEIDSPDGLHRFVVVAARGGDDVWVEVRVKHDPPPEQVEQASPSAEEGGRDEAPVPAVNLASGLAGADAVVQAIAVSGGEPGTPDADPRAALEAPEAEVRAEAAAAAAARESEQRAAHERREAELRALLETREAEVRAEAAALLASRETELAEQAAAALARHEQELAANAADALAAHKAEIENEWAVRAAALAEQADTTARAAAAALADVEQALSARETRLEALYERLVERESALADTEAASARRLADRAAELEAAFAMRLADADARACERKAAMDDAFEGRLSDAIAAAAKELETGLLTREEQRAAETAAAAAAEQEALSAAEAVAMRTAIDRAALEAEMQAALLAEQAASTDLRPEPAPAVGATPFVDMVAQGEDDARPVALLLPRHGAAGHSSTAV
ncbi:MAG: hypothetical protein H0X67_17525, partial [Acidobacteria bacterium]|nr:hypothetical protein [Acidobacteriota bacterium]